MTFADRLAAVLERVRRSGRDPLEIAIVAVTKGRSVESCREAAAAGLRVLGENRVQEAVAKMAAVEGVDWHLVGHLQRNKVPEAAASFALIHSVDSERLGEAIARVNPRQQVLLQVNVAREPQKHGCDPSQAVGMAGRLAGMLDLRGLMCIGPLAEDPRSAFDELAKLRVEAQQRCGRDLPVLSMGMSGDFEAALAAGSTMLRLGRVLFGNDD